MAYSAGKTISVQRTSLTPAFVHIPVAEIGETIWKGAGVIRKADGKAYMATQSELGRIIGIAENDVTTTGTDKLKLSVGPDLRIKAVPCTNEAEGADTYHAWRVISSDDDDTLDAKDDGVIVYFTSSGEVTAHPKIPNSVPAGRLFVETTGAEGTGVAYVHILDRANPIPVWNKTGSFMDGPQELGGRSDFTIPARRVLLAKQFKKPILAAAASVGAYNLDQDEDFIVVGSAGTNVLASRGGVAVLTGGSDNDIVQVIPDSTTAYSLYDDTAWSQGLRLRCEWEFSLPSAAAVAVMAGMRITVDGSTAAMDRTTDADFSFLTLDTDVSGETTFQVCHVTDGGTVVTTDTGVTAAADTNYIFTVDFDEDKIARYYLKAQGDREATLIYTAAAASSAATTLKPTLALATRTGSAKTVHIYRVAVSQDIV